MAHETYTVARDEQGRFRNPAKPLKPLKRSLLKRKRAIDRSAGLARMKRAKNPNSRYPSK